MAKASNLEVKICGLTTDKAVQAALTGGASHIGMIFFPKSPRNIAISEAAELRKLIPQRGRMVAVSVNADNDLLDRIVEEVRPDVLQLHGRETPQRVAEIKSRYGLEVMKAIAIRHAEDLNGAKDYVDVADRLLFDAKPPEGSDLPGGNGISFNWSLLRDFDAGKPMMLSGGLDCANIAEALTIARPDGVDISSGVETSPGVKNLELITSFLRVVKDHQTISNET